MSTAAKPRRRSRPQVYVGKPNGLLHPRVQQVGPERFGILCIDCAKARSVWMLADFYGKVLAPPATVTHARGDIETALAGLRRVMEERGITDAVAAVERTGAYHQVVQRALAGAGWEVRIVHPYATKQFRQPFDSGNKTDQTDLMAIHRAAVAGLGLLEPELDEPHRHLRLLTRHRRDLVEKASAVRCQIHEHLHAVMPGFAALFDDLWDTPLAMTIARLAGSPTEIAALGEAGLTTLLDREKIIHHRRSVTKILAWARTAPAPLPEADAAIHRQIVMALQDDHEAQQARIQMLERQIARLLTAMPYILLLSIPGVNVVSAADLAGEMGPITHYASATRITGRAGLFPSRYQSDRVDHADGPLVGRGNRRLRTALMSIADNMIVCNDHFAAKARVWQTQGKDPRWSRVKVAKSFSRIAFQMVAGRRVFHHPCVRERAYILDKLIVFGREHHTPSEELLAGLRAAAGQIHTADRAEEAEALQRWMKQTRVRRTHEPQRLGDILPLVLAELGRRGPESMETADAAKAVSEIPGKIPGETPGAGAGAPPPGSELQSGSSGIQDPG